ncbi:MAG: radical SAM protein, partial [Myxococcales bacterium]|nr:radical SAM protein [Myxococcales bacterium]
LQAFLFRHGVRCIVSGEAESTLPRIVSDYRRDGRLPPPGTVIAGEAAPDLDLLPFPEFDKDRKLGWMPVAASRGCVARCHFCEESRFFAGLRHRSVESVLEEIERNVERYRAQGIQFHDSLINFDEKWLLRFCRGLKDRLGGFEWQAFARPAGLPDRLLDRLRESGCTALHFGVEHFSQAMSDVLGKHLNVQDAFHVIERAAAHKLPVKVLIITGVPGETEADHRANLEALQRLMGDHPDLVDFAANPLMVTPHSLYFRRPEKFGIRLHRDRWGRGVRVRFEDGPDPDTILRRLSELLAIKPKAAPGHEGSPGAWKNRKGSAASRSRAAS